MTFDLSHCDRFIAFCRDQIKRLRTDHGHKQWAQQQADLFEKQAAFLLEVRREFQMRGPGGRRLDERALDAVPELAGKNALVLYFETPADVDEFVALFKEAKPNVKTVKVP